MGGRRLIQPHQLPALPFAAHAAAADLPTTQNGVPMPGVAAGVNLHASAEPVVAERQDSSVPQRLAGRFNQHPVNLAGGRSEGRGDLTLEPLMVHQRVVGSNPPAPTILAVVHRRPRDPSTGQGSGFQLGPCRGLLGRRATHAAGLTARGPGRGEERGHEYPYVVGAGGGAVHPGPEDRRARQVAAA